MPPPSEKMEMKNSLSPNNNDDSDCYRFGLEENRITRWKNFKVYDDVKAFATDYSGHDSTSAGDRTRFIYMVLATMGLVTSRGKIL